MAITYVAAEKPVSTKHDKLGDISFSVEVPQAGSMQEFVNVLCTSEDIALEYTNGNLETSAKNKARALARNFEVADGTDPKTFEAIKAKLIADCQEAARSYLPSAERGKGGPSKARMAAALTELSVLAQSDTPLTRDQLFQILERAKLSAK